MGHVEAAPPSLAPLEKHLRLEDVVVACTRIVAGLADEADFDQLLRGLAREVCGLFGVARCSVYLRSDAGDCFRGRVAHTGHDDDERIRRLVAGVDADGFTHEILATLAPVLIEDALHDPRPVRATMRAWGVRSMLGLPMIADEEVVGLLFLDDREEALDVGPAEMLMAARVGELCGAAVAAAMRTSAARAALAAESRGKEALGRVLALQRSLGEDLVAGAELDALAERVAIFAKKPVCVYGPAGELQAFGQLPAAATVLPFKPPASICDPELRARVEAGEERAAVAAGPFPAAGVAYRLMIARVLDRDGRELGSVAIAEHHGRLTGLDRLAAQTFAGVLALRAHAAREGAEARQGRRDELARDLLFGCGEEAELTARARNHGIRLGAQTHLVATIAPRDQLDGMIDLRPEPVQRALARVFRTDQVFVGTVDGVVFVLLAGMDEGDEGTPDEARSVLDGLLEELSRPDAEVVAVLARPCYQLRDFPRARRECERGVEVLRSLGGGAPRRTVGAHELGVLSLFGGACGQAGAGQFALDVLGELATPEGTVLLQTLAAYLDTDRSARDAAKILGVHQNTVRYRLGNIAKQARLDVPGSPDDELMARVAVNILRLQGRLPESKPAPKSIL